ncbi:MULTISPECIES: hypothetical protein [unclassified Pseudomonas]|uniref:hypothetical protein n=1 Tax=unclassified Pseudomonas TaxID=196821 RepID=UPI000BCDA19B|nr:MULTISPECIES: hypothetical protein [unclassified Pseudomonas]PVZ10351.1 hypothetical protein F474_03940 [Pseudomonas sp. URIL14HWK12:I12]PVZ21777.1 hypothetical protein F470_03940 [Pseudomonas sp. URIL14HWK12:I10]PVZ31140.1 hypothetical protein F472_04158 [Pseudomonas sp. URIL14HWK12:I11]SNZ17851.1 hypothetical protein SAMN05660463_03797 [Pseudomonas sp. URIL14HWK12:I9]
MNLTHGAPQPKYDPVNLQTLACWLHAHGGRQVAPADPRKLMNERYPLGLFSDAEMEVLASMFKR